MGIKLPININVGGYMKKKVLLLDIDYTVINTDSMIDFILYSLKTKPLKTIIKIPYIFITLVGYALKLTSLKKDKRSCI